MEYRIRIARLLEEAGHVVVVHSVVRTALDFIASEHVDLVIADIFIVESGQLSAEGGITLISRLKKTLNHPAPIIAISGSFSSQSRGKEAENRVLNYGADASLVKPFEDTDLVDLVTLTLSNSKAWLRS